MNIWTKRIAQKSDRPNNMLLESLVYLNPVIYMWKSSKQQLTLLEVSKINAIDPWNNLLRTY